MIDQKLITSVSQFGLSEKESAAYIALLSFGTATAREVSRASRLNRATTYVLLEALVKRGLVSISLQEKTRYYTASSPERLIQSLEDVARDTAEKLGKARSLLPELKSIYVGIGPKPKVTFYEGEKGIESIYEDTLSSSETILAFASIENMHNTLPHYFPDYYNRRAERGIKIKSIHPDTPEALERVKHNHEERRESALVPCNLYDFSPEINIYDNKIVFMSLREKFGLIIESLEIANAMKKVFSLAWAEADRLNKINKKSRKNG